MGGGKVAFKRSCLVDARNEYLSNGRTTLLTRSLFESFAIPADITNLIAALELRLPALSDLNCERGPGSFAGEKHTSPRIPQHS